MAKIRKPKDLDSQYNPVDVFFKELKNHRDINLPGKDFETEKPFSKILNKKDEDFEKIEDRLNSDIKFFKENWAWFLFYLTPLVFSNHVLNKPLKRVDFETFKKDCSKSMIFRGGDINDDFLSELQKRDLIFPDLRLEEKDHRYANYFSTPLLLHRIRSVFSLDKMKTKFDEDGITELSPRYFLNYFIQSISQEYYRIFDIEQSISNKKSKEIHSEIFRQFYEKIMGDGRKIVDVHEEQIAKISNLLIEQINTIKNASQFSNGGERLVFRNQIGRALLFSNFFSSPTFKKEVEKSHIDPSTFFNKLEERILTYDGSIGKYYIRVKGDFTNYINEHCDKYIINWFEDDRSIRELINNRILRSHRPELDTLISVKKFEIFVSIPGTVRACHMQPVDDLATLPVYAFYNTHNNKPNTCLLLHKDGVSLFEKGFVEDKILTSDLINGIFHFIVREEL